MLCPCCGCAYPSGLSVCLGPFECGQAKAKAGLLAREGELASLSIIG